MSGTAGLKDFSRLFAELVAPREAPSRAPDIDRVRSSPPPKSSKRKRFAEALRLVKAALKAGLPVKRATIEGVSLEFGEPVTSDTTLNEWDRDLGAPSPSSLRQ